MGLVKLGSGTSSVWLSGRGHSQWQDVECCRTQGALLSQVLLGKRKKRFTFLLLSDEKLQAGGVCLVFWQSHFLHFQSCLFVEFWAPEHPLCSTSLPLKKDRLWDTHKPGPPWGLGKGVQHSFLGAAKPQGNNELGLCCGSWPGFAQWCWTFASLLFSRTLEFLMRHLARLADYCSITNMHTKNLAIVWAPNLLRYSGIFPFQYKRNVYIHEQQILQKIPALSSRKEFFLSSPSVLFSSCKIWEIILSRI